MHQADFTARRRFRRDVTDTQARCPTREAPVCQQGADFAQAFGFQVGGRIEHFLHTRPALGAFVADHHHIARHHLVGENRGDRIVLALEHARPSGKFQNAGIHARRLDDTAVHRDVAAQHRQAPVLRIGMFLIADAAGGAVGIHLWIQHGLRKREGGDDTAGGCAKKLIRRAIGILHNVPASQAVAQCVAVYRAHLTVQQPRPVQLAQDSRNAARTMHVFHMVFA